MNHGMIVLPSSERDADERPVVGRFSPALLAVCGALLSLLVAAHVGASGPLDIVTKTVGDVTGGVTQTAQETTQTMHTLVDTPVRGTVDTVANSATGPAESVTVATQTVGIVAESVTTATQPATQQTAHIAGSLAQNAQPAVQAVAAPVAAVAQPATQTVATAPAPVVQGVAPIVQTTNTTVSAATPPVQAVAKPVVRPVIAAAAPVVQVAAPVVQTVDTIIAPTEPIVAPIVASIAPALQTLETVPTPVAATAPATAAMTSVAPTLRTITTETAQPAMPTSPSPVNRAERFPDATSAVPSRLATDPAHMSTHPREPAAVAVTLPALASLTERHATTIAADTATVGRARGFIARSASPAPGTRAPAVTVRDGLATTDASASTLTARDARIAPASPHVPSLPSRLPIDALATTASATGTSGGHGLSLFLSLATAGWVFILVGRRIPPSALNAQQPTSHPPVSPG
jgi:hypothetical protein